MEVAGSNPENAFFPLPFFPLNIKKQQLELIAASMPDIWPAQFCIFPAASWISAPSLA